MIEIRGIHPYSYRSGTWAIITGLKWIKERPCFVVKFDDNAIDYWPIYDKSNPYEFKGSPNEDWDPRRPSSFY